MKVIKSSDYTQNLLVTGIGPNLVYGIDIVTPDGYADPGNIFVGQTSPPMAISINNADWKFTNTSHSYRVKIATKDGTQIVDASATANLDIQNSKMILSYPWDHGGTGSSGTFYYQFRAIDNADNKPVMFPRMILRVRVPV